MNRRNFVAVGASAVAVTASDAGAAILGRQRKVAGERVTISGWIKPGAAGPGHYFVLGPNASVRDPRAAAFAEWSDELTLVYPADARALGAGKVTLQGRLHRGRFKDGVTGHAARAVLTEARLV
jgi:hypothetical protein